MKFSLFYNGIANTYPNEEITIEQFIDKIKTDTPLFSQIRANAEDKDKKNELKRNLSYVTFGGVFSYRNANSLIKSSGYACLDVDDIENLEEVKQQIIQNKFTHCLFTSPSGKGYKFIVKIPEVKTNEEYKQYWVSIARHYNLKDNDEASKDICRACYLSFDSTPYFNPDSEVYTEKADLDSPIILNNDTPKDTSRSAKEFGEVCRLAKKGLTDEEIDKQMMAFAKWSESPKQYKEITIKKAREKIDGEISLNDFLNFKTNKKGQLEFESVNIDKVAEYIEEKFNIRTIFGIKEETIEVYSNGVWTMKGRGIIKAEVERLLGSYAKNNVVNEVLEKVKRRTETNREEADRVPDYRRCVENGVLDLEDVNNIQFLEHSKEYNFRNKFPIKYNPSAECPNILRFMNESFYPEDVLKIQEWLGFCLVRRYSFKKALLIHGPKNTGKTIFVNLLTTFLGGNVSGLSLQEISRAKAFDLLVLKDKDANIHDDLSSADMQSIGGFKMAVGDGYINGEMKFGDKLRFRNTAKGVFTCNKIPSPKEDIDDDAYYERIILIPMENVIPKEQMDKNLIDKLTTESEMSGLLNWAIEGYKRLIAQNSFSNEKTPEETKFLMLQKGNSLSEFATQVLLQSDGDKIDKEAMYQTYCKWCMNHKPQLSPDTKEKIGRTLTKFAPYTQASSNGSQRYWNNVKFNTNYDTYDTYQKNMRVYRNDENSSNNDVYNNIYVFPESVISVRKQPQEEVSEEPQLPEEYSDLIMEVPEDEADSSN